jgi:hypothetical protein
MRMRFKWLDELFAAPSTPHGRPLRDLSRFEMGVCPGCRGLRASASERCSHCGSTKPAVADV